MLGAPTQAVSEMRCVPKWFRYIYTGILAAMVPLWIYQYGVSNFLWFSNLTLLLLLVAVWIRSRLLISMLALAVVLPEIGWNLDFWIRLLFGAEVFGLVDYMFDVRIPLWARLVSLFHVPLPFVLVWFVCRCGYEPRALKWQVLFAWIVLPISFFVSTPQENINLVYGFLEGGRPVLSPPLPLLAIMVLLPVLIYIPSHVALKRLFDSPRCGAESADGVTLRPAG